jgi:hypothetical protein
MRYSLSRHRARLVPVAAVALLLITGLACNEITSLKQENPGTLSVETLYVPANASLLVNGAIGDFECAYNRYVVGSGLFTDELSVAIAQTNNYEYDARRLPTNGTYGTNNCSAPTPNSSQQPGIYTPLSVARATADTAVAKLEGWTDADVPNRTRLIGRAAVYAGYDLTLLGEGMCSAALNLGPELPPDSLFAQAVLRFTKAIAAATTANDAATLNLARLGRARALLDLGGGPSGAANLAAAAADAALVPATFVATTSPDAVNARRQNLPYIHISQSAFSTVDSVYRNLIAPGATWQDPRVRIMDLNRSGTATRTRLFLPTKYSTSTSPVRVASYQEAQLIIAENAAATGDLSGAEAAINRARARTDSVPIYTRPAGATADDLKAQILEERRREFFLEGHRLGDLRRTKTAFWPPSGTAYPFGGVYGTQTCFPLPDVERINNPTIAGKG